MYLASKLNSPISKITGPKASKDIFSAIQLSHLFHAVMHARLLDKLIKEAQIFEMTIFDLQSLRTRVLYTHKLLEIIVQKIRLPVPYKSLDPTRICHYIVRWRI